MEELVQHSEAVPKLVEDGRMKCKEQNGEGCNMPPLLWAMSNRNSKDPEKSNKRKEKHGDTLMLE